MKINAYLCSRKQQNKKDYARDLPLLRNRHHDVSARPPLGPWDACLSKNPPHFHVRYNEYRATIDIQTGEVTGQMPRPAPRLRLPAAHLAVQAFRPVARQGCVRPLRPRRLDGHMARRHRGHRPRASLRAGQGGVITNENKQRHERIDRQTCGAIRFE